MGLFIQNSPNSPPFFTIGIPTYNRRDLLRQTLASIINQTFSDFEVIVGNDYRDDKITAESLDIHDPRIRFINHPENLGEVRNMNTLLGLAQGRYFTWQFDDDFYNPNFLQAVYENINKHIPPKCLFTSYKITHDLDLSAIQRYRNNGPLRVYTYSGKDFIQKYFAKEIQVMGCTGIYEVKYLKEIGGMQGLCDAPIGLYGEYLLLMKTALLKEVVYIDSPLVFYRAHKGSWGWTNKEVNYYRTAGVELIARGVIILGRPELKENFGPNFMGLLNLTVKTLRNKIYAKSGSVITSEIISYLDQVKRRLRFLNKNFPYYTAMLALMRVKVEVLWFQLRSKVEIDGLARRER